MPDIATALRNALTKWDDEPPTTKVEPEPTPPREYFKTTNNVCRATFDYIRDNPGKTRNEIVDALTAQGYKDSSTTTLIGQMLKQYKVRESQGLIYATSNEYTPLKSAKTWASLQAKAQRKKVIVIKRRKPEDVEQVQEPVEKPKPRQTGTVPALGAPFGNSINDMGVTDILNSLSIAKARMLYDALSKIFGSNT